MVKPVPRRPLARPPRTLAPLLLGAVLCAGAAAAGPEPRKLATIAAHGDFVSGLAFTPEGDRLISAGADKTVAIFDARDGKELKRLTAHPDALFGLTLSPTGNEAFVGGGVFEGKGPYSLSKLDIARDRKVKALGDGQIIESYAGHEAAITALAQTYDGEVLATGDLTGVVRFWKTGTGVAANLDAGSANLSSDIGNTLKGLEALRAKIAAKERGDKGPVVVEKSKPTGELRAGGPVLALAFSSDGKWLALAPGDATVRLYDGSSHAEVKRLEGHTGKVLALAFQHGTHLLASGSADRTVRLWNADSGAAQVLAGSEGEVFALAFLSDGKQLASGGKDAQVRVWDVAAGKLAYALPEATGYVRVLAVDRGARVLAAGTKSGTITLYRLPFGRDLAASEAVFAPSTRSLEPPQLVIDTQEHTDRVSQVLFTKDGRQVLTGSWDKTVRVWDAASGDLLRTLRLPAYAGSQGMIYAMALSPDERFLAVAGASVEKQLKTVRGGGEYVTLLDLRTGLIADVLGHHLNVIFSLGFSPDGKQLISGAGENDYKALVYSVSPEGKLALVTGAQMSGKVLAAKFSTDGKHAFLADELGAVARIDPFARSEFPVLSSTVKAIAEPLKLPDGTEARQATGGLIGESLKRKLNKMVGRDADTSCAVFGLAVDPTGKWLAAGDALGVVQLFNARVGLPGAPELEDSILLKKDAAHPGAAGALAFSPDGRLLAAAIGSVVKVVEVAGGKEVALFTGHSNTVFSVAFSPDGKRVVSTSGAGSATFIWEVATGKTVVRLGGKRSLPKIWSLGAHRSQPGLLGLGNRDPRSGKNDFGDVEFAFDFVNLRVLPAVDKAEYETAAQTNARTQLGEPEFVPNKDVGGMQLLSWLGLPNGRVVLGTEYGAHLRDPYMRELNKDGIRANALALGADGQTFYVGLEDGRVELFDTSTLQRLATLLVTAEKEWVLFTPDGHYAASRGGAKAVGWLMNQGVNASPGYYPFEQFDLRLNRPDLVLARLGYPGVTPGALQLLRAAREKRLRKMGLDESKLAAEADAPTVLLGRLTDVSKGKKVELEITATAGGAALERLQVWANDVPVFGSAGVTVAAEKGQTVKKKLQVELTAGRNKLQVSALDTRGGESGKETAYVTYSGPLKPPDLYVLSIGVSAYQDPAWRLDYAAKDAGDLAAALQKSGKEGFANVYVQPLLDKAVTREGVAAAKKFLQRSKADDQVVVFLAGHGLVDEKNEYYFGTVDVSFTDPAARGLPYDAIEGLLDGLQARKKLLLMDTCHSGELEREEGAVAPVAASSADGQLIVRVPGTRGLRRAGEKVVTSDALGGVLGSLFTDLRRGSGAMVISSASGQQLAIEGGKFKNGVFTYALLQGLDSRQADLDGDGVVKVGELRDYVIQKVTQLTQGLQTPTSRRENLEFDFAVVQYGRK